MKTRWIKVCFVLFTAALFIYAGEEKIYNGLHLNLGTLSRLSHAQTRSISPENFSGEKGKGGMSLDGPAMKSSRDLGQGWKVSPYVVIKPKQTFVMASVQGSGAIQQIWMTPAGNWRFAIIRFYWDGETEPSV
jgi:D-arabinan exo alpha-(1,3)/(1,5)-arabinofuranosidase (non-reducing end)